RHRMRRLTAAGDAAPGQIPRRVAPGEHNFLPRHAHHLGGNTLTIGERLRPEVADAGLDVHPAIRLDDEEAVEADRARVVRADRDAAAAHFVALAHAASRFAFIPLEHLGALIKRLLDETTSGIRSIAACVSGTELRLAGRRVDLADLDLVDATLARTLRDPRLHQPATLDASRVAARAWSRRVGGRRVAAPAHRLGLKQQRREAAGRVAVVARSVRSAFDHGEHVERGNAPLFGEPNLHPPVYGRTRTADAVFLLAADAA